MWTCAHLVCLFQEGQDMLGTPPPLPALQPGASEPDIDRIFGDDAALAREIWAHGFEDKPSEAYRELPLLRRLPGAAFVEGDLDAGWIGDGPWIVAYVPDREARGSFRDETLGRLADRATAANSKAP